MRKSISPHALTAAIVISSAAAGECYRKFEEEKEKREEMLFSIVNKYSDADLYSIDYEEILNPKPRRQRVFSQRQKRKEARRRNPHKF